MKPNPNNSNRPSIQLSIGGSDSMLVFNRKEEPLNDILEEIVRAEAIGPGRRPLSIVVDEEKGQIIVTGNEREINDYNSRILEKEEKISAAYAEIKRKLGGENKG